jgi:hypothetical protein
MNPRELCDTIRSARGRVLPLVGAGLALDAGAPSVRDVAAELSRRFELGDCGADLGEAARRVVALTDRLAMQTAVAEIVARTRPRPTPALIAVASAPTQTVLTTNYDDAVEQSVRARGGDPVALLPTDEQILDPPGVGIVHVVHLHGVLNDPSSIVLPGEQMDELKRSEVFQRLLTAAFIPHHLLYLGFGFSASEVHLRTLVKWLAEELGHPRQQWLPLGATHMQDRREDLAFFASLGNVEVVEYDDRHGHQTVVDVAQALAPRSYDRSDDLHVDERLTWVTPALVIQKPGEHLEDIEQRIAGLDFTGTVDANFITPQELDSHERTVVVATPGMGKSKLVSWLPHMLGHACATGQLRDYKATYAENLDRNVMRLLINSETGQRVSLDDWQGLELTVVLDGLDELDASLHQSVISSLRAMATVVPGHRVILTTRPVVAVDELDSLGFDVLHILPSRRWAQKYLQLRALTSPEIARALAMQTLGDLTVIPLFAELLADRLLDATGSAPEALGLLVDSQLEAVALEARRAEVSVEPLEDWLRTLALDLQLRGTTAVPVADLPPATESSPSRETVERLRQASVLGDTADQAAFARRTQQEALVADSILKRPDPALALESAAVATINGRRTIRDDFDYVADLVFEHATHADRETLRTLDEERWARTAVLRGTINDGRAAFAWLDTWHRTRHIPYLRVVNRNILRSPEAAVLGICRRWPQIARQRRRWLVPRLRDGASDVRARALAILATLPPDAQTESWLIPCLDDSDAQIVAAAADAVAAHKLVDAAPKLIAHLGSRNARVRISVLRALLEILPGSRLREVGPHLGPQDPPGPIAQELAERLNLDDALAFLESLHVRSHTCNWLLDRLIETTPTYAWTAERTAQLMSVLRVNGLAPGPNYEGLATVVALHLSAALDALRPTRLPGSQWAWHLPDGQARTLLALDPDDLAAANPSPEVQHALAAAREQLDERQQRQRDPAVELAELETIIDHDPIDLEAVAARPQLTSLGRDRLARLTQALDASWPAAALASGDAHLTDLVIYIGVEIAAAITATHWWQLLDAHLRAQGRYGLGDERITDWLASTRPAGITTELAERVVACENTEQLHRLTTICGLDETAVVSAARDRLLTLDVDGHAWTRAALRLADRVDPEDLTRLLEHAGAAREQLVAGLAKNGSVAAQKEALATLAQELGDGEDPEPPTWPAADYDASFTEPLSQIAAAADASSKVLAFAVNALSQIVDRSAVAALDLLAAEHPTLWWIRLAEDHAAARLARACIINRIDARPLVAARALLQP